MALGGTTNSTGIEINAPTGYLQSWNLTIERDLGGGMALEIGYVGSKGTHLSRFKDINLPPAHRAAYLAGIAVVNLRPFPYFNGPSTITSSVQLRSTTPARSRCAERGRGGTFYRLNYAYSKIDRRRLAAQWHVRRRLAGCGAGHQQSPARSRPVGLGSRPRGDGVVLLAGPVRPRRKFSRRRARVRQGVFGGWQFSGTVFFATGAPIHRSTSGHQPEPGRVAEAEPDRQGDSRTNQSGQARRGLSLVQPRRFRAGAGVHRVAKGCPPDPYGFQPFVYGNSGRNILDGPGYQYINVAMMKNFRWESGRTIQFRIESYNVFNHANFMLPDNNFNTSTAGMIPARWRPDAAGRACFRLRSSFFSE